MIPKRSIVAGLVGLNVLLLAGIVLSGYSLPAAFAQRSGASSNFVAVTARVDANYDALFLVDLGNRKLHCFTPNRDRTGDVQYAGQRNLERDFGRE